MNAIPPHASFVKGVGERRTFAEMWQPYHAASGSHTRTVSTQRSWLVKSACLVDSIEGVIALQRAKGKVVCILLQVAITVDSELDNLLTLMAMHPCTHKTSSCTFFP